MRSQRVRSDSNVKTLSDTGQHNLKETATESSQILIKNVHVAPTDYPEVIFIEPFYGGSHKQLTDILRKHIPNSHLITLTAKKWHWRARCSSLIISALIPQVTTEHILFCSSVLSLAELLGLRPDLCALRKVVYFHENQLVYPIREIKERDVQFAYNQITTCLAADVVVFNSQFNMNSFLDCIKNVIRMFPDNRPKDIREKIEKKCQVMYFPLEFPQIPVTPGISSDTVVQIVWPHRWEFDKNPQSFMDVLLRLKTDSYRFKVALMGETFTQVPETFVQIREFLSDNVVNFGYIKNKEEYYTVLQSSHLVVSTAVHEFFGVSMLEASYCGCFPLAPKRLVYPEIYPEICLYRDDDDLYSRLKDYCMDPGLALQHRSALDLDFSKFSVNNLLAKYLKLLT